MNTATQIDPEIVATHHGELLEAASEAAAQVSAWQAQLVAATQR